MVGADALVAVKGELQRVEVNKLESLACTSINDT